MCLSLLPPKENEIPIVGNVKHSENRGQLTGVYGTVERSIGQSIFIWKLSIETLTIILKH